LAPDLQIGFFVCVGFRLHFFIISRLSLIWGTPVSLSTCLSLPGRRWLVWASRLSLLHAFKVGPQTGLATIGKRFQIDPNSL
jgi:hypothetical protein